MMSASTMTFLGVAPGAAAPAIAADAAVPEGADFMTALAALAAGPVTTDKPLAAALPVPQAPAGEQPLPDAEAMATLLAGMLPAAPVEEAGEGIQMPAHDEDALADVAAGAAEDQPAATVTVPGDSTEAAVAAAAVAASVALPVPAQAQPEGAIEDQAEQPAPGPMPQAERPRQAAGASLPAYAAKLHAGLLQAQAQQTQAQHAAPAATTTSPVALQPADQAAQPAQAQWQAAASVPQRESSPVPRNEARTAGEGRAIPQGLRGLLQAMARGEAAQAPATTSTPASVDAPLPLAQELQPSPATSVQEEAVAELLAPGTQTAKSEPSSGQSLAASGLLHTSQAQAATPATTAAGSEHVLRSAVGTPRWAEEMGNHLVLMSARGQQEGSLTLTPEHLGPLEVRISVNQNTANVWFGAQHADTRAALAEALPRLREMFDQAGLSLGHAGVSQEAPRQERREARQEFASLNGVDAPASEHEVPATVRRINRGLLDTYA